MGVNYIKARQKQRIATSAEWQNANPVLLAGELGIESDTYYVKAGDGSTAWNDLSYLQIVDYYTKTETDNLISTLNNTISELSSKLTTLESSVSTAASDISTLQGNVSTLSTTAKNLQSSLDTANSNISTLLEGAVTSVSNDTNGYIKLNDSTYYIWNQETLTNILPHTTQYINISIPENISSYTTIIPVDVVNEGYGEYWADINYAWDLENMQIGCFNNSSLNTMQSCTVRYSFVLII